MTNIKRTIIDNKYFLCSYVVWTLVGIYILINTEKGDLIRYCNEWRTNDLYNQIFQFITSLAEEIPYAILTIILFFVYRKASFLIPILGISVTAVSYLLKNLFHQPRPYRWFQEAQRLDELVLINQEHLTSAYSSFPSGHTMSAFGLCTLIALLSPNKKIVAISLVLLAYLIGFSRIYLTHHFLEDVLAGAAIGLILAFLLYLFFENIILSKNTTK